MIRETFMLIVTGMVCLSLAGIVTVAIIMVYKSIKEGYKHELRKVKHEKENK